MITMKEWMELVDYKITEGSDYGWDCYGIGSYQLDSWNGLHDDGGFSFCIIFNTQDQTVYEVQAHDYTNQRAYRMINPDFQKKMKKEAKRRNVDKNQAWDNVDYVTLDVDDDFIQKSLAIKNGEEYDTRVMMNVEFTDEDLFQYMKMAHERDMTFNKFVEEALRHAIAEVEAGRLTKEDDQKWLDENV